MGWLARIAVIGVAAGALLSPAAALGLGYSNDPLARAVHTDWMGSKLADSLRLSEISVPGAHDAGSAYSGGDIALTQSMSISEQLRAGIRALDIRVGQHDTGDCSGNGDLWVLHGISCQQETFRDVLRRIRVFLDGHPQEFVLMRLKHEREDDNDDDPSDSDFEDLAKRDLVTFESDGGRLYGDVGDQNPTVAAMRGRLVVLQNVAFSSPPQVIGIGWGGFHIQDQYDLDTNWDLGFKWLDHVEPHFRAANEGGRATAYVNFLSASGGGFPYFFASGKSSPQTNAPQLLTGWLRGPDAHGRIDCSEHRNCLPAHQFPSTSCTVNDRLCSVLFRGLNDLATAYLFANDSIKYAGLVFADFPGDSLIETIIDLNDRNRPPDVTPPTVAPVILPPPNAAGWHKGDLIVVWPWTDEPGGTGVDFGRCPSLFSPTSVAAPAEGILNLGARCSDNAGNEGSGAATVRIDRTPPSAQPAVEPAARNGWHRQDVTVNWHWSDARSGIDASACADRSTTTGSGAAVAVTASCNDIAGNAAQRTETFQIDQHPPSITLTGRPAPNAAGWHRSDVTVRWRCEDDLSGAEREEISTTVSEEGADLEAKGVCTDVAGNTVGDTQSGIRIDKTPPAASPSASGERGDNGWYVTPVEVLWNWTDSLSGRAPGACRERSVTTEEGAGVTLTGSCTDVAGNSATPVSRTFDVDLRDPTIAGHATRAPDSGQWHTAPVDVSFACDDPVPGSGVARCPDAVTVSDDGDTTVRGTAVDVAGRMSAPAAVTVRLDRLAPETHIGRTASGEAHFASGHLRGSASDASAGVASVVVTWEGVLLDPAVTQAAVECTDAARRTCSWSARAPSGLVTRASAKAIDRVARQDATPDAASMARVVFWLPA